MRMVIVTFGSRGDVQPYVALGRGLQAAGHAVTLCTHAEFEPFVREHGLDFAPVHGNVREMLAAEPGQRMQQSGQNPVALMRAMAHMFEDIAHELVVDCLAACRDADAVVHSLLAWFGTHHVTEKLRIPALAAYLQPVSPTRAFPAMGVPPTWRLGGTFNLLSYAISQQGGWLALRGAMNAARRDVLGLPPEPFRAPFDRMHREHMPILYGYSAHVLPKPLDWGDWIELTGYWFLDALPGWQPPAELAAFLRAGPPPVYVGFGSMRDRRPTESVDLALDALRLAGRRGVLLAEDAALAGRALPGDVCAVTGVPHEWLFPRMAAIVHHGGAGTTAAALRAGVPAVTVPYFGDQPFWAQRVYALGAGPKPIPRQRVTAARLAAAIDRTATDAEIRAHAAGLGAKLRAEDGVGRAVARIHEHFGQAGRRAS